MNAIDPDKLSMCLQVLADIEALPPEHPDAVVVRRATAGIFKSVKQARRHAKRDAEKKNAQASKTAAQVAQGEAQGRRAGRP